MQSNNKFYTCKKIVRIKKLMLKSNKIKNSMIKIAKKEKIKNRRNLLVIKI
jgi:hypothetical protein